MFRAYEKRGGAAGYIGLGPGEPRSLWISEGPHSLRFRKVFSWSQIRVIKKKLIYYLNSSRPDFSDYKITLTSNTLLHQLVMIVTALYQVYVIWTFCCTGNKAFMKVYQWFYRTSNPQFWGKSQSVSGAPKQSCSALQKFLLEALAMLIMIRNLTYSDLDSCHPEVMVPDARVFRSIKNEQKYPWLYQCGTPIKEYLCKFYGHSSSLQEFVTVGINLGTVWLLFYYWTSKLKNSHLFPIHIIYALIFPIIRDPGSRYKWVGKSLAPLVLSTILKDFFTSFIVESKILRNHWLRYYFVKLVDRGECKIIGTRLTMFGRQIVEFLRKRSLQICSLLAFGEQWFLSLHHSNWF